MYKFPIFFTLCAKKKLICSTAQDAKNNRFLYKYLYHFFFADLVQANLCAIKIKLNNFIRKRNKCKSRYAAAVKANLKIDRESMTFVMCRLYLLRIYL